MSTPPRPLVGYVRVSTDRQDIGPEVQRAGLRAAAALEGAELVLVEELGVSAATIARRPLLRGVLADLAAGQYAGLLVYSLDRLSRSLEDGARVLADSQRQRWRLVCLDLNVDTGTPFGAAMFGMSLTWAELERRQIGDRTRAAMAVKVAAGEHMGRPRTLPVDVVARVVELRAGGSTLRGVAEVLNAEEVPTATGAGTWTKGRVQGVLRSRTAAQLAAGTPVTVPAATSTAPPVDPSHDGAVMEPASIPSRAPVTAPLASSPAAEARQAVIPSARLSAAHQEPLTTRPGQGPAPAVPVAG